MSFKVKGPSVGEFETLPENTPLVAVLTRIVDLKVHKTPYVHDKGPRKGKPVFQHKAGLFWQFEREHTEGQFEGQRFRKTQTVSVSLFGGAAWGKTGTQSTLSKIAAALLGKAPTEAEVTGEEGFDLESLEGKSAVLYLGSKNGPNGPVVGITNVERLQDPGKALEVRREEVDEDLPDWAKELIREGLDEIPDADDADNPLY